MLPGPLPSSGGLPIVEGRDDVGAAPPPVLPVEMKVVVDDVPVLMLIDTVVRAVPQENKVATPAPQAYLAQDGLLPELQVIRCLTRIHRLFSSLLTKLESMNPWLKSSESGLFRCMPSELRNYFYSSNIGGTHRLEPLLLCSNHRRCTGRKYLSVDISILVIIGRTLQLPLTFEQVSWSAVFRLKNFAMSPRGFGFAVTKGKAGSL